MHPAISQIRNRNLDACIGWLPSYVNRNCARDLLQATLWGVRGWVGIDLDRISDKDLIFHVQVAWELVAPKRLLSKVTAAAVAPKPARKQRGK